ncbi:ammonium transporter [Epithele typhae]|uniref:ammonium transporter n=1 Tax=Epithele typhae TaxID=378194 RepID=UPI0020085D2C|nr:ammonium transporter [Epithele typhae]KAH9927520.1 ammonium transporter [Epithele typhae]
MSSPSIPGDANDQFDRGDVSFIAVCGILVFFMVPGVGEPHFIVVPRNEALRVWSAFLYSGLSRRKSALSLVWAVAASNAVAIFQWWFWGYSLAFSPTATNGFIGNLRSFAHRKLLPDGVRVCHGRHPHGCPRDRGRVVPAMVFTFLWMTLVYCPIACWAWSTNGWGFKWGVLDYAGGGPVEIGSGISGLAYSWVLGRRSERELRNFRPHNVSLVALGTFILWFGWLGFNGGSAFGANLRALMAIWNSMLAAAMAGLVWCALDWRVERKVSMVGLCSGMIAGLVAATPASGYIPQWAAVAMGIVVGAIANYSTKIKFFLRIDDALDLCAEHAIGGIVGLLFNGLFADAAIIALDGVPTSASGGWLNHNWKQLYIQLAYVAACCGYAFTVTALLAAGVNAVPGLHLRATPEQMALGMDDAELGEFATDYVEVRRDYTDWTPPYKDYGRNGEVATTVPVDGSVAPVAAGDRHGVPDSQLGQVHAPHGRDGSEEEPSSASTEKTHNGDLVEKV